MTHRQSDITRGLWLGLFGIVTFAATLPVNAAPRQLPLET